MKTIVAILICFFVLIFADFQFVINRLDSARAKKSVEIFLERSDVLDSLYLEGERYNHDIRVLEKIIDELDQKNK